MQLYIVKYTGPFGFIKPWSAVRDELTFSQLYLTQSILTGMSQKLFGLEEMNRILRHRLSYEQLIESQERTLPKLVKSGAPGGVLKRRLMLQPILHLAFGTMQNAEHASAQHICLCRNEDVLLPSLPVEMTEEAFNLIPGFEYHPTNNGETGVFHGWYRTLKDENGFHQKQFGNITRTGEPMRLGEIF